ncbi:response regulator [Paucibacter sp. APW11]|uniref:Response regulator n=1 Tax=Roseateles aquae TaxID=3077235 RepID=A0ABU3PCR3_9BURK|nr:response regulator [Paucibacter sp. APW11]MDT9000095.1 response regulator [Paucibacter sp. APW11]
MKSKILIVEDQADIRRLIRWSLEDSDSLIHEAANGTLALQIAKVMKPDLMLLDVMMPGGIDGLEVCKEVKKDPELAHTIVIMLTAKASSKDHEMAREVGADAFLPKPFSPARLLELIEALLKQRGRPAA